MTPSELRAQPARRSTDHGTVLRRFQSLMGSWARSWDPVAGGQLMLLTTGIVVVLTLPLLRLAQWQSLAITVSATTATAWTVSLFVPWQRLPRNCTLGFPLFAWAALATLGASTHGIAASYSGLFVLWFAYIGLTHPSGTSLLLVPLAVVAYVIAWGGWSSPLIARLLIAATVWLMLSELLAALIERQRVMTDEMRQLAHLDPLTNLANRRDLDLRMAEARPGDALVLCDLDHFKQLNDTLGHAAGDEVLTEFGLVVRATLRQYDYAARYGGEEFALLLPSTTETQAMITLARLRTRWAVLQPHVTFSAGVAVCRSEQPVEETMRIADRALYAAKAAGRNRVHGERGRLGCGGSSLDLLASA